MTWKSAAQRRRRRPPPPKPRPSKRNVYAASSPPLTDVKLYYTRTFCVKSPGAAPAPRAPYVERDGRELVIMDGAGANYWVLGEGPMPPPGRRTREGPS